MVAARWLQRPFSNSVLHNAWREHAQFCAELPPQWVTKPPAALEVPWTPGAKGPNSSVTLTLRTGLRSTMMGASEVFQMYLIAENDIVSGLMQQNGGWEMGELQQILRKLDQFAVVRGLRRRDVVFVDVGANVGAYTLFVAAHGFSVLAFEPLYINVMALRHSLCANPQLAERIRLLTTGLGNESRSCGIWTLETNQGDGTVVCQEGIALPPGVHKRQDLQIARLDDVLAGALHSLAGRVGAMKIDVEGHELSVVRGGQRFFLGVQPAGVMTEVNDGMMLAATGEPARALLAQMHELGYSVREGSFNGKIIRPHEFPSFTAEKILNYWYTRKVRQ